MACALCGNYVTSKLGTFRMQCHSECVRAGEGIECGRICLQKPQTLSAAVALEFPGGKEQRWSGPSP